MKKTLLLFSFLLCCIGQGAAKTLIDGIYYELNSSNGTASVTYATNGEPKYSGSISIPNTVVYEGNTYYVTSIGDYAFNECSGLISINIPNSVTSIGTRICTNCPSLASIVVDKRNTHFDSRGNCNAIIETSSNTLISGCKNTTIPNSVTSIGNSAFSGCTDLISIKIPNSVTSIGGWAFMGCI